MITLSVQNVDFLPASYRQRGARHRDRAVRLVVAAVGLALLATAWSYRQIRTQSAIAELDSNEASYQEAVKVKSHWQRIQTRREAAEAEAQLVTYLRHPWPMTQVLGAVVSRVPPAITLTEIKVVHEAAAPAAGEPRRVDGGAAAASPENREPGARQDLTKLRRETDGQSIVLTFAGETTDGDELHRLLAELPTNAVVFRADIVSLQGSTEKAAPGEKSAAQFHARVLIQSPLRQPPDQRLASHASP